MGAFKLCEENKISPCTTFQELFTTICRQLKKENLYPEDMIDYIVPADIPEEIGLKAVYDNIGISDIAFHKINSFDYHRRKPITFRWWVVHI